MKRLAFLPVLSLLLLFSCSHKKTGVLNTSNLKSSFIGIDAGKENKLKTPKGAIISIAANSFDVPAGTKVNIEIKVSLDVPTAFTPNGDGINDIIYPGGWGIRKLYFFKVFNRWGQLVFESNDLKIGWDGVFQGVPQNMETYVYQVSAETFLVSEPIISKSGTFKLIR